MLDNLSTGHLSNLAHVKDRIEFVRRRLDECADVAAAVRGVDCVFHEAALASVPRSVERPLDTNAACVTGTLDLLDAGAACRRATAGLCRRRAAPTAISRTRRRRETDLPAPISPYGAAKLAAELYCQAFTPPTVSRP